MIQIDDAGSGSFVGEHVLEYTDRKRMNIFLKLSLLNFIQGKL